MVVTMPSTEGTRSGLTRVTLVGPRRVDLVLPSHEAIGVLLPEIVRLTGHLPASPVDALLRDRPTPPRGRSSEAARGYLLSLLDGRVLDAADTFASAGVADGALVRVDPVTEAPPAAVVYDLTDEIADDLDRRRGRWGAGPRRWTATAVVVAVAGWATVLAASTLAPGALLAAGVAVLLAGAGMAAAGGRAVGVAVLLGGAAVAGTAVPFLLTGWPAWWGAWLAIVAVAVLALGATNGWARAAAIGGGTVLALLGSWVALLASGLPVDRTAALLAVVSTMLLGLLPRLAIVASGLTRLDDRQVDDEPVSRVAVAAAVDSAHRGLALAVVSASASAAVAGWLLAQAGTAWTIVLAGLVALAMLLRLRAYPLVAEVVALVAGSVAVVVGLVDRWMLADPSAWWGGLFAYGAVAAMAVAVLVYEPLPHIRARARQVADGVEALAVVALVPVAVGVFGVYSRLLSTF